MEKAFAELDQQIVPEAGGAPKIPAPPAEKSEASPKPMPAPQFKLGDLIATREAYGAALAKLGERRPARGGPRRRRQELDLQRQVRSRAPRSLLPVLHRRTGDDRRRHGSGRSRLDSVPVHLRRISHARRGLHPHGGDQRRQHQGGRLACGRVDRRGRSFANGARRSLRCLPRSPTSWRSIRAMPSPRNG